MLGVRVKNDCIKDCIKLGSIFKKKKSPLFTCLYSPVYFPSGKPFSLHQCSHMWWQRCPDSARKNGMNCSFLAVCCPFLITLMSKWQHYYYTGQLLPLEKIWISACLSKSSSICQPLSSVLVFSFVSYSTQQSVSPIHSIRGIQIQILYFKRGQCTLINISIADSNCTWFSWRLVFMGRPFTRC